ncbi:Fe-S cluster assembly protein SufD [Stygiobacter electus]|uniref:Fe-S cluster assembly protein SufD n=1 Tax=Stygiobacter electus TaxID=3032292 RepID=A0AAE3P0U1_9BACT|nr:Fe-S cluster assembly protein SufD [Stygiobacter electus]MDF1612312.1 Fe-S cluster assembly protein SufD [Stygiobacter electus]
MNIKGFYIDKFIDFEKKLNGESITNFHSFRKDAIAKFKEIDFPTTKNEEWRFTDVSPITKQNFIPANLISKIKIDKSKVEKIIFTGFDFHLLVFVNGIFEPSLSEIKDLPKNVFVGSLKKFQAEKEDLFYKHFNKIVSNDTAFNFLNSSFSVDGFAVYVPKNIVLEKPIQVLFINGSEDENILISPRNLFVVEENSQMKLIVNYNGLNNQKYFSNIITEIFIGENAIVDYYQIQNENDNSYHIEKIQAIQKDKSLFNQFNITFGGEIVRNDINSKLDGEYIETHFYGLYMINGKQHVDNHTFVDHAKPNCMSNELYKGILDENSHGVFNGKIIVRQDAQKTNAYQQNKTILLYKGATIDTKPQLEIFADDVKCSHGATVGHLDEVSEFYIRSRGVPKELAKSMLIRAFANDVIETMKITELKEQINHMIFQHLHQIEI